MQDKKRIILFRTAGRLYKPLEKLTSVSRAKPVSFAVWMKEGEKREALLQKILGRIRQAPDIRYDIVSNGWYAVASEGGEICKANFASWVILKVLRISGTFDYWQTTGTVGDHMVRSYPGRYGLRLYDCRIPTVVGIPKKSVPGNANVTPKMLGF